MAIYTRVDAGDLQALIGAYAIGELEAFEGVADGVTNSTYFVDTTLGRWVLTVFEDLDARALPFFMQLMDHLAGHGVPAAHPVTRRDGGFLSVVRERPAALTYRLPGASVRAAEPAQCAALGRVVAEMHRAAASFGPRQGNARSLDWIERAGERVRARLTDSQRALFAAELVAQQRAAADLFPGLSRTVIHADLFRDNVLLEGSRVTGLIDFFYACEEYALYELAVICSDWAYDDAQRFDRARWRAFVTAYARRCPLGEAEAKAWPAMLRAVALRFWASRLVDYCFPPAGQSEQMHDPSPLERLLVAYRDRPPPLMP